MEVAVIEQELKQGICAENWTQLDAELTKFNFQLQFSSDEKQVITEDHTALHLDQLIWDIETTCFHLGWNAK